MEKGCGGVVRICVSQLTGASQVPRQGPGRRFGNHTHKIWHILSKEISKKKVNVLSYRVKSNVSIAERLRWNIHQCISILCLLFVYAGHFALTLLAG